LMDNSSVDWPLSCFCGRPDLNGPPLLNKVLVFKPTPQEHLSKRHGPPTEATNTCSTTLVKKKMGGYMCVMRCPSLKAHARHNNGQQKGRVPIWAVLCNPGRGNHVLAATCPQAALGGKLTTNHKPSYRKPTIVEHKGTAPSRSRHSRSCHLQLDIRCKQAQASPLQSSHPQLSRRAPPGTGWR
jgi:hypothetical protein